MSRVEHIPFLIRHCIRYSPSGLWTSLNNCWHCSLNSVLHKKKESVRIIRVYFPIKARSLNSTKRLRVLHVTCVLVALLLPLIPAVTLIIGNAITENQSDQPVPGTLGYGTVVFPPVICSGLDANIAFYTLILPSLFFLLVGTICLVLVIWKINKVSNSPYVIIMLKF